MSLPKVLIVDDEPDILEVCQEALEKLNLRVMTELDATKALKEFQRESWDLVLVDLKMPEMDGISFLKKVLKISPGTIVCLITGYPTVESAVEAVKLGAYDYVTKPFTPDQIRAVVKRAIQQKQLREENYFLRRHVEQAYKFDNLIGKSPESKKIFGLIQQIAQIDSDVLILGESGTGKELVARSIHSRSKRSKNIFVPIDCGAIPENLLESELFGFEKGTFTNATSSRMGLLEFAHQGTFFLDEICELSLSLQAKLLRAIQERSFRRIGGREEIRVDVRVIAATNKDIEKEVKEKRFRDDLYYRLNVMKIKIPPLRERKEDIEILINHFIERFSHELEKPIKGIEQKVKKALLVYHWPGNVRELQNVIKHGIILTRGDYIALTDIPDEIIDQTEKPVKRKRDQSGFFDVRAQELARFEQEYFKKLLIRFNGDVSQAAKEARLPKGTFYRFLKKYHLIPGHFRK